MAIKISKTTVSNILVKDSYARVEGVLLTDKKNISFRLRFYNDPTLPNESSTIPFFEELSFSCGYDLSKSNPIEQAYVYLKTLPEFEGSTNC